MKLKSIWLAGVAAAALVAGASAPNLAAADPIPPASSYADLLQPVADAPIRLAADDAMREQSARLTPVRFLQDHHHHHHHHHHSRRWYRDNGYYWNGGDWAPIPEAHHHHHHADWYRGRGYRWNGWAWILTPQNHHHHHHHHHHQYQ